MLYREFRPTVFDAEGAFLPDRQDWLVVPVSRTRDSGPFDESNFESALEILCGESETCEVHRFGHWGPGWFEIIIVDPSRSSEVDDIERSLADYPVLDDEDLSRREWESAEDTWHYMSVRERVDLCREHGVSIFAARRDEIPQDNDGRLFDALRTE